MPSSRKRRALKHFTDGNQEVFRTVGVKRFGLYGLVSKSQG